MRITRAGAITSALMMTAACGQGMTDSTTSTLAPTALERGNPADAAAHTYRVTIENLTTGQPISPGVVVTHTRKASVFSVGSLASEGVRLIAENGDPSTADAMLKVNPEVFQVVATGAPIHRIGGPGPASLELEISAAGNASYLSMVQMLICTNDGFTGVDTLRLPGGFTPEVYLASAYDAGTEANNEAFDQIVDPCQAIGPSVPGPALPNGNGRAITTTPISHHPNIQGGSDLTIGAHGWSNPVARITVVRIK